MEKLNEVDAVVPHPELPEVISPELVLIDPELAEIARRLLPDHRPPPAAPAPPRELVVPPIPVVAVPADALPAAASRRLRPARSLAALITHGIPMLVVGAVLLGMVASELRVQLLGDGASLAAPTTVEWTPTANEVEIRAFEALNLGVQLRVPPGLIDEKTGLLRDNVNISCRRVAGTISFGCTVRAGPAQPQAWRLTVVPSRDGDWKWRGLAAAGRGGEARESGPLRLRDSG